MFTVLFAHFNYFLSSIGKMVRGLRTRLAKPGGPLWTVLLALSYEILSQDYLNISVNENFSLLPYVVLAFLSSFDAGDAVLSWDFHDFRPPVWQYP